MSQPPHGPGPQYGYGWPAYGQGPPPPPPKQSGPLPCLIIGGVVVLSGLGLLLVVMLRPQVTTGTATDATRPTAASSAPASASASASGQLPGGAPVADRNTGGRARFDGSDRVALSWVQAMAGRHFRTAYDLSCAQVRQAAIDAAAGGDPAEALGSNFFHKTLSGYGFSGGSFDSIIYSRVADSDIASFTLRLDNGEEFLLLVYVQGDGTVCDFG